MNSWREFFMLTATLLVRLSRLIWRLTAWLMRRSPRTFLTIVAAASVWVFFLRCSQLDRYMAFKLGAAQLSLATFGQPSSPARYRLSDGRVATTNLEFIAGSPTIQKGWKATAESLRASLLVFALGYLLLASYRLWEELRPPVAKALTGNSRPSERTDPAPAQPQSGRIPGVGETSISEGPTGQEGNSSPAKRPPTTVTEALAWPNLQIVAGVVNGSICIDRVGIHVVRIRVPVMTEETHLAVPAGPWLLDRQWHFVILEGELARQYEGITEGFSVRALGPSRTRKIKKDGATIFTKELYARLFWVAPDVPVGSPMSVEIPQQEPASASADSPPEAVQKDLFARPSLTKSRPDKSA